MNTLVLAYKARKTILQMHYQAQSSHIASSLSCVDILSVLYGRILRVNPKNPQMPERDRFILSKGHAVSALYAVLMHLGFCDEEIVNLYHRDRGKFPGHATKDRPCGIEISTGSLGHGLSIGAGLAYSAKADKKAFRTFILLSDGECNEGSVWEAALFAAHHALDNMVAIVDDNGLQGFGRNSEVLSLKPFARKWRSFGWEVREINGHNHAQIFASCKKIPFRKGMPSVIIAKTVKGKGIPFMEGRLEWHYKSPKEKEYQQALSYLRNP